LVTIFFAVAFLMFPAQGAAVRAVAQGVSFLTPDELQVKDAYHTGDAFSFTSSCTNIGNAVSLNVVIRTSDPWIDSQKSISVGDNPPGGTKAAVFSGHVPQDAPLGAHVIIMQCVSQNAAPAFFSYVVDVVERPITSLEEARRVLPPSVIHIYDTAPVGYPDVEPNAVICQRNDPKSWDNPICREYYDKAGYIRNPLYFEGTPFGSYSCVVATAAYGSPMAPEVVYMRNVRDEMIGSTPAGGLLRDAFDSWYYSWAPPVAQWISGSESLRALFRVLLIPIVLIVHVTALIFTGLGGGDLAATVSFLVAAILSIGIYMLIPAILLVRTFTCLRKRVSMRRLSGSLNLEQ
jgi:hypothetical protein